MADFKSLKIAGLTVRWGAEHLDFVSEFLEDEVSEPVATISFRDSLISSYSVQYPVNNFSRFLKTAGGELLFADESWRDVTIYGATKNGDYTLPLAALCSRFAFYNAILVHASLIEFNGNGLMFIGPSGIGKTTQAQLWNQYKNADIINGDKAFVRIKDGAAYSCGLPWKGSSPYCLNRDVKLTAIVVLSQADNNAFKKIGDDSIEKIMPHIFFPHWDKDCLNKSLDTLAQIAESIPVYSLECKPDEEAVRLVCNAIFG